MDINFQRVEGFFKSRENLGIKPGLDRVNSLLKAVSNPERKLRSIHVAGTNGKGSTISFLNDSLMASGYDVGVFTSPSMTGLCGHIKINDKSIAKEDFVSCLNELMPAIKQLDEEDNHPSEFEIITVIALLYFKTRVDFALIEAGMGGRLDTTNCILPLLSIITTIEKDHTHFLGDTVEAITYEKAGIIKHNTPVIIGNVSRESMHVIEKEAEEKKAVLYKLNKQFSYRPKENRQFTYVDNSEQINVSLIMEGHHQIENASLALKALSVLEENNFHIKWDNVIHSIGLTNVPGRFETVMENPLIILDGAHNEASMNALIETVQTRFNTKQIQIIFAAFKDKALNEILCIVKQRFKSVTFTTFDHPRAASVKYLTEIFQEDNVKSSHDWRLLLDSIIARNDKETVVIITGSLHFIFLVRHYIKEIVKN